MSMLEDPTYSTRWAENTISDIARRALNHDGLLDKAFKTGAGVYFLYDRFPDRRVKRVSVRLTFNNDPTSGVIIGSVERDDGQPFREDLRELFEQVRNQLLLLL